MLIFFLLIYFCGLKNFFLPLPSEIAALSHNVQLENMQNFSYRWLQFVTFWDGFAGKVAFGLFFCQWLLQDTKQLVPVSKTSLFS